MLFLIAVGFSTSCSNISNQLENQLNELDIQTERLDSLIHKKTESIMKLDTLISSENFRIKKLDALIEMNSLIIN